MAALTATLSVKHQRLEELRAQCAVSASHEDTADTPAADITGKVH